MGTLSRGRGPNKAEVKKALEGLDRLSERLSIPDDMRASASSLCTKGIRNGLARHTRRSPLAAASLYVVCREKKFALSLDDLSAVSGVGRTRIAASYRLLVNSFNIDIPVADPAEYVAMVASRAKASECVREDALKLLMKAERSGGVPGRNPIGLAASALYMASNFEGEGLTQSVAALAAGVAEATLRKECQQLRKAVPKFFLETGKPSADGAGEGDLTIAAQPQAVPQMSEAPAGKPSWYLDSDCH